MPGPEPATVPRPPVASLSLDGGHPALDLTNTVDPRHVGPPRHDYLQTYEDLVEWSVRARTLEPGLAPGLLDLAASGAGAEASVARARRLREAAYRALSPRAEAPPGDLELIERSWREATSRRRLVDLGERYALVWDEARGLDRPLWPLALAVVELQTSPSLVRVKECDADGCGWLFLDVSKAGRRRWCSMASCGNREKARRYRASRASRAA